MLVDHVDRPDRVDHVVHLPDDPHASVLPHERLAAREVLDHRDHRPALAHESGNLAVTDLHDVPPGEAAPPAIPHRDLYALRLVDGQHLYEARVADGHELRGLAEFDAPGGLSRVERGGIRGVQIDEPVARPEVHDLPDDLVVRLGDVPPAQGNDVH